MNQKRITALILALFMLFLTACDKSILDTGNDLPASTADTYQESDSEPTGSTVQPENAPVSDQTTDAEDPDQDNDDPENIETDLPKEGQYYYDLKNVVLYLELYSELPPNYITKKEAQELGWQGGSVEKYKEGAAIGGDHFGNYEGKLPKIKGRSYTECDIDTDGYHSRGSRRLIFSDDGLYYYTSDHYETFSEVTVTEDHEVIW